MSPSSQRRTQKTKHLPLKRMCRETSSLESNFDLLVVGGGIFGVCVAWEATQRGLHVALIERGDFSGATSGNSFRFLHGGIRYLQSGDLRRVRQSSHERQTLLRIAPHLVRTLPVAIPTYGHGRQSKGMLRSALMVYDLLTADRNRAVADPARQIPNGKLIGRDAALNMFPGLDRHGLSGAAIYWDGQILNPERLVLSYLKSAADHGAVVANYVEAVELLHDKTRIHGVSAVDRLSGQGLAIRAQVVVNAAGPHALDLLKGAGISIEPPSFFSRDVCFTVPRPLVSRTHALALLSRDITTNAWITRGKRHLFLAPWRNCTLVGVWHSPEAARRTHPLTVTEDELNQFTQEVNGVYPTLKLSVDDVAFCSSGLVPLDRCDPTGRSIRFGRRARVIDHSRSHGLRNLVTVIGQRFTMARHDAAGVTDLVCEKLKRPNRRSLTDSIPLSGGDIGNYHTFLSSAQASASLAPSAVRRLVDNFGAEYTQVLRYIEEDPTLGEPIGDSQVLKAQAMYAAQEEMAFTLADVVCRRTDLAMGDYPGQIALRECAELVAPVMGWTEQHIEQEIQSVQRRFTRQRVKAVDRRALPVS